VHVISAPRAGHFKREAAADARQIHDKLVDKLGAPVFLDSDDVSRTELCCILKIIRRVQLRGSLEFCFPTAAGRPPQPLSPGGDVGCPGAVPCVIFAPTPCVQARSCPPA
jgi:hypothetical protein